MSENSIRLERDGHVARITLCRPDGGNLIDVALVRELADACASISSATGVRAVILTGEGNVFSRGWDWQALAAAAEGGSLLDAARMQGMSNDPFGCLAQLTHPVVCAV